MTLLPSRTPIARDATPNPYSDSEKPMKRQWIRTGTGTPPILLGILILVSCLLWTSATMAEGDGWKTDFERLCGYTDIATTLEPSKLTELIGECDLLLERLQKLSDPKKKMYIFRTKKCRDLFRFVLETKGG